MVHLAIRSLRQRGSLHAASMGGGRAGPFDLLIPGAGNILGVMLVLSAAGGAGMVKRWLRRGLRGLGYDVVRIPAAQPLHRGPEPPAIEPVWPLPRVEGRLSVEEIQREFALHPYWHYAYAFEGGLAFSTSHHDPGLDTDRPERPLQRFRHFMPYVVHAAGGSLAGKRVLDIACNSGFWSIQCALLGADVVGFDARPELIAEADLVKRITGADRAEFRVLPFREMTPERLGEFDVVLNLGFLYHVAEPLAALERTRSMTRQTILLDTAIHPSDDAALQLKWEEPTDIRMAADAGVVALPTRKAVEMMLRHLGVRSWAEIPVRSADVPVEYRTGRRASWVVQV